VSSNGQINIALAGIAGYGDAYLEALLPRQQALGARLVGVVDPMPQRCRWLEELHEQSIPVYSVLGDLFAESRIDLMLIVTPIHLHAHQSCYALERGANVLCEKPVAGALADAIRMGQTQARARGFAAIGYQWSFSAAVQALKRDILAGELGRPIRMRAQVFFPRPIAYFRRNDWAGRIYSDDGLGIFDSPVNNAAAHYLHNMFYILGPTRQTSSAPVKVQAELYRANDIENYDTAALRCMTECGTEVLFYTSHAVSERRGPRSRYEFELATVEYDALGRGEFIARFRDGHVRHYGHPNLDRHDKIWQSIEACRGGEPVACPVPAAVAHALCVAAAQESADQITDFPARLKQTVSLEGDPMISVDFLGEQLTDCYDRALLPSEDPELKWARQSRPIKVIAQDLLQRTTPAGSGACATVNAVV
jgi:predicted dehydrogenase